MIDEIKIKMEQYNPQIQTLFTEVMVLIKESVLIEVKEKLWAQIPSFYVEERFVRIIPFKDHINVGRGFGNGASFI